MVASATLQCKNKLSKKCILRLAVQGQHVLQICQYLSNGVCMCSYVERYTVYVCTCFYVNYKAHERCISHL